jgi:hypothetical protein
MFERFTQGARRVIFFARYEASNYGSPFIETEHLLLGVFREDRTLAKFYPPGSNVEPELRADIERHIVRGERISTSVEVPLSQECKRALNFAAETAERHGHRVIEPRHLLVGILRVEESLGAKILTARGFTSDFILERIEKTPNPEHHGRVFPEVSSMRGIEKAQFFDALHQRSNEPESSALLTVIGFLSGLKTRSWQELMHFFSTNAQFIDASGKRWNRDELASGFDALFAPYGKKNASYVVEATLSETHDLFVAVIRWNNALLASEQRAWMHRMTLVLILEADNWAILLIQVTPVDTSASRERN